MVDILPKYHLHVSIAIFDWIKDGQMWLGFLHGINVNDSGTYV